MTMKCSLCNFVFENSQESNGHKSSMLHHREIEKAIGRGCTHKCFACNIIMKDLPTFAQHLGTQDHKHRICKLGWDLNSMPSSTSSQEVVTRKKNAEIKQKETIPTQENSVHGNNLPGKTQMDRPKSCGKMQQMYNFDVQSSLQKTWPEQSQNCNLSTNQHFRNPSMVGQRSWRGTQRGLYRYYGNCSFPNKNEYNAEERHYQNNFYADGPEYNFEMPSANPYPNGSHKWTGDPVCQKFESAAAVNNRWVPYPYRPHRGRGFPRFRSRGGNFSRQFGFSPPFRLPLHMEQNPQKEFPVIMKPNQPDAMSNSVKMLHPYSSNVVNSLHQKGTDSNNRIVSLPLPEAASLQNNDAELKSQGGNIEQLLVAAPQVNCSSGSTAPLQGTAGNNKKECSTLHKRSPLSVKHQLEIEKVKGTKKAGVNQMNVEAGIVLPQSKLMMGKEKMCEDIGSASCKLSPKNCEQSKSIPPNREAQLKKEPNGSSNGVCMEKARTLDVSSSKCDQIKEEPSPKVKDLLSTCLATSRSCGEEETIHEKMSHIVESNTKNLVGIEQDQLKPLPNTGNTMGVTITDRSALTKIACNLFREKQPTFADSTSFKKKGVLASQKPSLTSVKSVDADVLPSDGFACPETNLAESTPEAEELQEQASGGALAFSKLRLPTALQRDLVRHLAPSRGRAGSAVPEPNLSQARHRISYGASGGANTSTGCLSGNGGESQAAGVARKSDSDREGSSLKPALQQLLKIPQRSIDWEQAFRVVTRLRQEAGKGQPRFGIEMASSSRDDVDLPLGKLQEEPELFESLQDFLSYELGKSAKQNHPVVEQKSLDTNRGISSSVPADQTSFTSTTAQTTNSFGNLPLDSKPEGTFSLPDQNVPSLSGVPPNEDRKPLCKPSLTSDVTSGSLPPEGVTTGANTREVNQNLSVFECSSPSESDNNEGRIRKRRRAGVGGHSPDVPGSEQKSKRMKVKCKKEQMSVSELLSLSMREEELSQSLPELEVLLDHGRTALSSALLHLQKLMQQKQQVMMELNNLRTKRIHILQELQGSSGDLSVPGVKGHSSCTAPPQNPGLRSNAEPPLMEIKSEPCIENLDEVAAKPTTTVQKVAGFASMIGNRSKPVCNAPKDGNTLNFTSLNFQAQGAPHVTQSNQCPTVFGNSVCGRTSNHDILRPSCGNENDNSTQKSRLQRRKKKPKQPAPETSDTDQEVQTRRPQKGKQRHRQHDRSGSVDTEALGTGSQTGSGKPLLSGDATCSDKTTLNGRPRKSGFRAEERSVSAEEYRLSIAEVSSTSDIGQPVIEGLPGNVNSARDATSSVAVALHGSYNTGEQDPTEGHFEGHTMAVSGLQIFEDVLYTCGADKTVRAYDLVSHKCLSVFEGHASKVNEIMVTRPPGLHPRLYSGSSDHTIRCCNLKNGQLIEEFPLLDRVFCLHERWNILFAGLANGSVVSISTQSNKVLDTFECHGPRAVSCLATSQEGSRHLLLVGSYDTTVTVRDAGSGLLLRALKGHNKSVLCMQTGQLLRVYKGHRHTVMAVCVLGQVLLSACLDRLVRVFDLETHDRLQVHRHKDMVMCMTVHKSVIYTGCYNGMVQATKLDLMQNYRCWWQGCLFIFGALNHLKDHLQMDHMPTSVLQATCFWKSCGKNFCLEENDNEMVQHLVKHAEMDSRMDY
uniref:Zinc finger protein 106a n=1 Tax=Eptatretus burgeri TaxID=7764 RepID=A0A8C4QBT2_EPTBU